MRTKALMALVLAAVCGLLVAVRAQVGESRRRAPAADVPPDWAPRLGLPAEDPADEEWPYERLSAEERAVVDRGRDVTGWEGVHQAFSPRARE